MCFHLMLDLTGLHDNECQSLVQSDILILCSFGQTNQPGPSNRKQFDLRCPALPLYRKVMMFSQPLLSASMSGESSFEELGTSPRFSLCLARSSPPLPMQLCSLNSLKSLLKCHLLNDAFLDHCIQNFISLYQQPCLIFLWTLGTF